MSEATAVAPADSYVIYTPGIYALFKKFDTKYFESKLKNVKIEWSKRMSQCAGICYQHRNRSGNPITIRLSEPLLKLRPRRYTVDTLLHEMIHAYLFLMNIREGNGGHGVDFMKIADAINRSAGTNITVYHNFCGAELMREIHVWRCNGICQHFTPFYGWVVKNRNRAPGSDDYWWSKHRGQCEGSFEKVDDLTQENPESDNDNNNNNSNTINKNGYVETAASRAWAEVDDGIMLLDERQPIIEICDSDNDGDNDTDNESPRTQAQHAISLEVIKRELLEDLGETDDTIELIDNEFVDALAETNAVTKFADTLMAEFNRKNKETVLREVVTCPVCEDTLSRKYVQSHLEGCLGINMAQLNVIDLTELL